MLAPLGSGSIVWAERQQLGWWPATLVFGEDAEAWKSAMPAQEEPLQEDAAYVVFFGRPSVQAVRLEDQAVRVWHAVDVDAVLAECKAAHGLQAGTFALLEHAVYDAHLAAESATVRTVARGPHETPAGPDPAAAAARPPPGADPHPAAAAGVGVPPAPSAQPAPSAPPAPPAAAPPPPPPPPLKEEGTLPSATAPASPDYAAPAAADGDGCISLALPASPGGLGQASGDEAWSSCLEQSLRLRSSDLAGIARLLRRCISLCPDADLADSMRSVMGPPYLSASSAARARTKIAVLAEPKLRRRLVSDATRRNLLGFERRERIAAPSTPEASSPLAAALPPPARPPAPRSEEQALLDRRKWSLAAFLRLGILRAGPRRLSAAGPSGEEAMDLNCDGTVTLKEERFDCLADAIARLHGARPSRQRAQAAWAAVAYEGESIARIVAQRLKAPQKPSPPTPSAAPSAAAPRSLLRKVKRQKRPSPAPERHQARPRKRRAKEGAAGGRGRRRKAKENGSVGGGAARRSWEECFSAARAAFRRGCATGERQLVWNAGAFEDVAPAEEGAEAGGRSEYASERLRESRGRRLRAVGARQLVQRGGLERLDPHALVVPVAPESAMEIVGEEAKAPAPEGQPGAFKVRVHPHAAFLADLHAHLSDAEIIGLLGGRWDAEEGTLYVQAAYPCESVERSDDGATDVEMDPSSQMQATQDLQDAGLSVVGWYHSHPTFQPDPSITDLENQSAYQSMYRAECAGPAPFIGLIVGTYGTAPERPQSLLRWFHVWYARRGRRGPIPFPVALDVTLRGARAPAEGAEMRCAVGAGGGAAPGDFHSSVCSALEERRARRGGAPGTPGEGAGKALGAYGGATEWLLAMVAGLARYYATSAGRVRFPEKWKASLSKAEKFQRSLGVWVPFMQVPRGRRVDFLADVLALVFDVLGAGDEVA